MAAFISADMAIVASFCSGILLIGTVWVSGLTIGRRLGWEG